jgi:hypothetical protein
MILTVEPKFCASGVKKKPQTRPVPRHSTATPVSHGSSRDDSRMKRVGFAYSQIDIGGLVAPLADNTL